ncbi:MAG: endo-1,4-beta-xylanase [Chloroflexota bacterium]
MKIKNPIAFLLIVLILAACAPAASVMPPTETLAPTPLATATPAPTPTITLTPGPELISNAKDLPVWVEEFVHAYGGKVMVNGVVMNASQLAGDIRTNSDKYIASKKVNGVEISFITLNDIPIALREYRGQWQEASMAKLSKFAGIIFEFSPGVPPNHYPEYSFTLRKVAGEYSRFTFPSEMDTCHIFNGFSPANWKSIITQWQDVEQDLNHGKIPNDYPYQWQEVYDIMNLVHEIVDNPQFRAQHLVENRQNYCMLADSIINLWENEKFSQKDMLKILEFVVRTRVIKFPEVLFWDVQDEMIAGDVEWTVNKDDKYRFWLNATGKTPSELTLMVADWVKKDNPNAKTYITESDIFNFSNPMGKWFRDAFDPYIKEVVQNNIGANSKKRVDGIIDENNLSIHYPLDILKIKTTIEYYNSLGLEIGGSETMVFTDLESIQGSLQIKKIELVPLENRRRAQADMYSKMLNLYLEAGIKIFGFAGFADLSAWTEANGWDTKPLLFDKEFRAKPAYYAIVQVLYSRLP